LRATYDGKGGFPRGPKDAGSSVRRIFRMKSIVRVVLVGVVVLGLGALAFAETVILKGKLACAHCTLKKAGVTSCQDVLVVAGKDGAQASEYWLVKNPVVDKAHTCKGEKGVIVTGSVLEKDGKKWLTATRVDEAQ
jgi:hypothetical protein